MTPAIVRGDGRSSKDTHYATERLGLLSTLCGRPNKRHAGNYVRSHSKTVTCRKCLRIVANAVRAPRITPKARAMIRADLARVARLAGIPEGYGPSLDSYREHGALGPAKVRGAVAGFRGKNPHATWGETLRFFGLKPVGMKRTNLVTREAVLQDVRRVAVEVGGRPTRRQYERLGRYSTRSVYRYAGGGDGTGGVWGSWARALDDALGDPEAITDSHFGATRSRLLAIHADVSSGEPLKWEAARDRRNARRRGAAA